MTHELIRTCKTCSRFAACQSGECDDHVCEDYRKACPLPRIGSKEWGWKLCGGIYCTDKSEYYVRPYPNHGPIIFNESGFRVSQAQRLNDAKRIAELLARRDWRRENRGKR